MDICTKSIRATREEILRFISTKQLLGCCSGDGSGYSGDEVVADDVHGSGYNYSSGYGYESCSGDGSGYGAGSGNYSGDCYGCGSGCGDGFGYVDGNGTGYIPTITFNEVPVVTNIKSLNGNIVDYVDAIPTIITKVRDNIACGYIINNDLTLSPCYIAKVGNSFAHGDTLREAVAYAEEKEMNNMPINERIKKFVETFGSLDSEHTGKKFYDWHHILTSSCSFGRNSFCKDHNINLDNMYTVRYFLDITKNSYGSDVIKLIRKAYKILDE